jgi:O-methyltransferase involved in polyketide biosynthesis
MYISRDANAALLRQIATLAPGSTLVASFMPPAELLEPDELPLRQGTERGARAAGTPMISFFTPQEIVALARDCGFQEARHVSAADLTKRYFYRRTDGLRPSGSEEILMATT